MCESKNNHVVVERMDVLEDDSQSEEEYAIAFLKNFLSNIYLNPN